MITIIVAIAENGAIGYKGDLIYHLSADLKRFKQLTTGNTVIMGRKTFQSLPKGALPNRRNIVLTRQKDLSFSNAANAHGPASSATTRNGRKGPFRAK